MSFSFTAPGAAAAAAIVLVGWGLGATTHNNRRSGEIAIESEGTRTAIYIMPAKWAATKTKNKGHENVRFETEREAEIQTNK